MDYHADEEVARLLARSDELAQRSKDVNLRGARESSALMRLLARCEEVCNESDRVYRGQRGEASAEPDAGAESRQAP